MSNAEHAAVLVAERRRFLQSRKQQGQGQGHRMRDSPRTITGDGRSSSRSSRGHAHDPTDVEPLFFGIGAGGHDDPDPDLDLDLVSKTEGAGASTDPDNTAHSSSPGEKDDAQPLSPGGGVVSDSPTAVDFNVYDRAYEAEVRRIHAESGRRATMFLTQHVNETAPYRPDDNVVKGEGPPPSSSRSGGGGGAGQQHMFADLISRTLRNNAKDGPAESDTREERKGREEGE